MKVAELGHFLRNVVVAVATYVFTITIAVGGGLASLQGEPQNGADVNFDFACSQGWVDVSGNSTPFFPNGEGIVLVVLQDAVSVTTPSENLNLNCRGSLPLGEQFTAVDFLTGQEILATLATMDELCAAIGDTWPEACRGRNGPFLSSYETVGVECFATDEAGNTYFTQDWISITTKSGASTLNCHFDLEQ